MKKFFLVLGIAAFATTTVLAQDTPKKPSFAGFVSNGFWDNWEVSFGLGTGTAFSNGGNIGPRPLFSVFRFRLSVSGQRMMTACTS